MKAMNPMDAEAPLVSFRQLLPGGWVLCFYPHCCFSPDLSHGDTQQGCGHRLLGLVMLRDIGRGAYGVCQRGTDEFMGNSLFSGQAGKAVSWRGSHLHVRHWKHLSSFHRFLQLDQGVLISCGLLCGMESCRYHQGIFAPHLQQI